MTNVLWVNKNFDLTETVISPYGEDGWRVYGEVAGRKESFIHWVRIPQNSQEGAKQA